jgi:hypothetical protein
MTSALQQVQKQLADMANTLGQAVEQEEHEASRRQTNGRVSGSSPALTMSSPREDALISEIDAAYKELATTRRKLARAEAARRRYERRARVDNADNLVAAKSERVAQLYLEGILDKDEYGGSSTRRRRPSSTTSRRSPRWIACSSW